MSRVLWPFRPLSPIIESVQYATDVFRAKATEQRHALRLRPRRVMNFEYVLTAQQANYLRALVRSGQSGDGFFIPDWTASDLLGPLTLGASASSSSVVGEEVNYSDAAILWSDETRYEMALGQVDSNGFFATDPIANSYPRGAYIAPVFDAWLTGDIEIEALGADRVRLSAGFLLDSQDDTGASTYPEYRSLPVVTDCPLLPGGLSETLGYNLADFDNLVTDVAFIASRDVPEYRFTLRWRKRDRADQYTLRKFIYSRYGRQKAFWVSSFLGDYELAASISGTTVTVYSDVQTRSDTFDIEIKARDGTFYRRQVTSVVAGSPVGGRDTVDLTIDSSVTLDLADVARVSRLVCARFNSDQIEFDHTAGVGLTVAVGAVECPVP